MELRTSAEIINNLSTARAEILSKAIDEIGFQLETKYTGQEEPIVITISDDSFKLQKVLEQLKVVLLKKDWQLLECEHTNDQREGGFTKLTISAWSQIDENKQGYA
jgi:hypothetical protein